MTQHATLTIRRLDAKLKHELRMRAASHGRSMEEEAREILRSSLAERPTTGKELVETVRRRFAAAGYLSLKPRRRASRPLPTFE